MKFFKLIIINPIVIWMYWLIIKLKLEFINDNLKVKYLAKIRNSNFGKYNIIDEKAAIENVKIGDFSYVAPNASITNTIIGKFTCIGQNVIIGPARHPVNNYISIHPAFYSNYMNLNFSINLNSFETSLPVRLGSDVWVGANAIIMGGIEIGDGVIIAAGAVVTKNIQPYAVVAGIPAKIIKFRFKEEEIIELLKLKWWDKDLAWLKSNSKYFSDTGKFKKYILNLKDE